MNPNFAKATMDKQETRQCQNCKNEFTIESDDFAFYEKMGVPAPNLCPECRFRRRAALRNETTLYKRKCDLCEKSVISMFNPKSSYVVYCSDCWESDSWDPYSFAQEYNEKRPFLEQLAELVRRVPKKAVYVSRSTKLGPNINSEYTNFAGGNKDCYLIFNGGGNENVMYSRGVSFSRDSLDSYFGVNLESCYETINVNKSSGALFCHNAEGILDSAFLLNSSGCQNCFGCVNLRHKSYHFFNEPVAKEEYEKRIRDIQGSFSKTEEIKKKFYEFSLKFPRRENSNLKTVNSTGDYLFESKNLLDSFEVTSSEDCRYLFSVKLIKDSYDVLGFGYDSELLLETVGCGYSHKVMASWAVENSQDVTYSFMVRNCQECIGCDSIRNEKYCILNKRYDEKEYKKIHNRIIEELKRVGEYGLAIPPSISLFAYNETVGQDNLPLSKERAVAEGFRWEDDIPRTKGHETIQPEDIQDHIKDVPDSILKEVLKCVSCGYNYRLIRPELEFYKKMLIPVPRKCFNCRYLDRLRRRGPFKLYARKCAKCGKGIQTTYAPERKEIVYCEVCYQLEVV